MTDATSDPRALTVPLNTSPRTAHRNGTNSSDGNVDKKTVPSETDVDTMMDVDAYESSASEGCKVKPDMMEAEKSAKRVQDELAGMQLATGENNPFLSFGGNTGEGETGQIVHEISCSTKLLPIALDNLRVSITHFSNPGENRGHEILLKKHELDRMTVQVDKAGKYKLLYDELLPTILNENHGTPIRGTSALSKQCRDHSHDHNS